MLVPSPLPTAFANQAAAVAAAASAAAAPGPSRGAPHGKGIDKAVQTDTSRYGAELAIHMKGLSTRMTILCVVCMLLMVLNGCSYFLFFRTCYLTSVAIRIDARSAPGAFYGVSASVFFEFALANLTVQTAIRTMIQQISFRARQQRIMSCLLLFVASLIPVTITSGVTLSKDGFGATGQPYGPLVITTMYLNGISMALALCYVWTSTCVDWIDKRIRQEALRKRRLASEVWNDHLTYLVSATAAGHSSTRPR